MDEIKIFVAPYTNPSLGRWFTLPMSVSQIENEVRRIANDESIEDFMISDFEAPFKISETEGLDYVNELAEKLEDLPDEVKHNLVRLSEYEDIGDIIDNGAENFIFTGESSMRDIAEEYVESCGGVQEALGDKAVMYFNFDALGRDMEIEGNYFEAVNGDYIEYVG
ncbi:antirestriction protein ArdA [Enterococcus rotai]|uniref:antirestriction protein ArdA n=1 Tax=Enterococcus rotai TaxID=118060 RepID=UPI0032B5254F